MNELLEKIISTKTSSELWLEGKRIVPEFTALNEPNSQTITAVDGGSATILDTTSLHALFVRIVAVQLNPKEIEKKEGFIIVSAEQEAKIRARFVSENEEKELFITQELELSEAANIARKLLEWELVDTCKGITVWDGSFTTKYDFESPFVPSGLALAKSSTAIGSWNVFSQAPKAPWYAKANRLFFARFSEQGRVFRVENKSSLSDEEAFSSLVPWSQDPVFIGYPYPLILADQLARVSNEERSALRIRLKATAGKRWEELSQGIQDAHDILDKIQY